MSLKFSYSTLWLLDYNPDTKKVSTYILDFMAFLRTITDIPSTYEDLTWCAIKQIPTGYNQVDIVLTLTGLYLLRRKKEMVKKGRIASPSTQLNQEPLVISRNFCQMVKTNQS